MKKRTFFTTLILFLVFIHMLIGFILNTMLKDRLSNIKERVLAEQQVIAVMMYNDMLALSQREIFSDENLLMSLQQYSNLVVNMKASFSLFRDETVVYQNKESDIIQNKEVLSHIQSLQGTDRFTAFIKEQPERFYVVGALGEPFESYRLLYDVDISATIDEWKQYRNFLLSIGAVLSLFMAVFLFVFLHKIFKPLTEISKISGKIAKGQYDKRLPVRGRDELAEVAAGFNNMACKIQNQIQELDLSSRQKQEFIDNFAHELKTPLTAIYGYAEYLQKAVVSEEEMQEALFYILSECERIQNMAKQLMDLAVLRESEFPLEELSIKKLLEETQGIMLPKASIKGVTLSFLYEMNNIKSNNGLLKHLLTNMIANSIQSCERGGMVSVKAFNGEKGSCIKIEDNGRGMNANELEHITQAFYRVDKPRSREEGGAGLGLAICSKIAELLNIQMVFNSQLQKGTTVFLYFTVS